MLYFDFPRVKQALEKEVQHGRYVMLPPYTDPSPLNVSAMGVAPRFKSFERRRAFESFIHQYRPLLKHAALDDFEGRTVSSGPVLASLGDLKDDVKWRVIHDLTHPEGVNVNAFMNPPTFQLPTAVSFAQRLSRGAYIWKGDIDSAFRNVVVRPRDWHLLAFYVDGTLYVDTRLPFGHALSPYYFVNFVGRPVMYVAARRGATLLGALAGYIDDFFGGCDDYDDALFQMEIWLKVCADLGIPVSKAKTFLPAQVVEILGFLIDTAHMSISVDPERIQDILDVLRLIQGWKAAKKRDLEGLAGKMSFVCSVVPGGRTFMREILDTMNKFRSKSHWAHLSQGFREDMAWWQRFAQKWNGVEAIPQPVSIPWRWLSSDASGDKGLGLFLCGAALHIPLPLDLLRSRVVANDERDLIIAETELIAAVLLVALAAPLFSKEHLLVGVDNTVAISWMDKGTAPRPRAMRALRLLWRIQAHHRVNVSTRYIPSEQNTLADAASRLDAIRFRQASQDWLPSHGATCRDDRRLNTGGRASLVSSFYGIDGGLLGLLTQYLVEGTAPGLVSVKDVETTVSAIASCADRFVEQKHRAICDSSDGLLSLFLHRGLRKLLGNGHLHHLSCVESLFVPRGLRKTYETLRLQQQEWEESWRRVAKGGPAPDVPLSLSRSTATVLAAINRARSYLSATDSTTAAVGDTMPQDESVEAETSHLSSSAKSLVPLGLLDRKDLAMATPFIPEFITRAVFDQSHSTLQFAVALTDQLRCPPGPSACGSNDSRPASGCDPPP
jgi:hypothetical protein